MTSLFNKYLVSHARHGSAKLRTGGSDNNVKTMRLDELVKEDVGVIKIDVEGHEWEGKTSHVLFLA